MRKLISLAVWGDDPKYQRGAVENVRQGHFLYPQWEYVIYVYGHDKAEMVQDLSRLCATIVPVEGNPDRDGLYVRMSPIMRANTDIVLIRDTDSRPSERESACVRAWEASGAVLHTIRDHRRHTTPIMGGLWGCRPKRLHELLPGLHQSYCERLEFCRTAPDSAGKSKHGRLAFSDQDWLADAIWAKLPRKEMMVHDDRRFTGPDDLRLAILAKTPMDFCGQVYSADNKPFWKPS